MITESEVRSRIDLIFVERKLNANKLSCGDKNLSMKIYKQINQRKTLSIDVIAIILNAIPDLNTEWLFRGIGSPFKDMTSPEQRLNDIEERLSALEGERETKIPDSQQHTA